MFIKSFSSVSMREKVESIKQFLSVFESNDEKMLLQEYRVHFSLNYPDFKAHMKNYIACIIKTDRSVIGVGEKQGEIAKVK